MVGPERRTQVGISRREKKSTVELVRLGQDLFWIIKNEIPYT